MKRRKKFKVSNGRFIGALAERRAANDALIARYGTSSHGTTYFTKDHTNHLKGSLK